MTGQPDHFVPLNKRQEYNVKAIKVSYHTDRISDHWILALTTIRSQIMYKVQMHPGIYSKCVALQFQHCEQCQSILNVK